MRIPTHWTRARLDLRGRPDPSGPAVAFGWSEESPQAALAMATERARRVAEALRGGRGQELRDRWTYYPLDRPLMEPVLGWLVGDGGRRIAALTRNGYGAVVLNAERVGFVDIDLPPPRPPVRWLDRVLGRAPPPPPAVEDKVRAVVGLPRHRGLGLRLYRTAAGYRALVTSRPMDPRGEDTDALMEDLEADPLYAELTLRQECFRARLTPKPWRVSAVAPHAGYFPWDDDPARRSAFEAWLRDYDEARAGWAVCRLVGTFGAPGVHPEVAEVLATHDAWTCTNGRLA